MASLRSIGSYASGGSARFQDASSQNGGSFMSPAGSTVRTHHLLTVMSSSVFDPLGPAAHTCSFPTKHQLCVTAHATRVSVITVAAPLLPAGAFVNDATRMQSTTPRASTSGPEIPFEYTQPSKDKAAEHAEATIPKEPPATIAGRRNLRNFESRPPPTDFETWKQSEAALQAGISTKQMVQREFERNFGPDCVQCAPR